MSPFDRENQAENDRLANRDAKSAGSPVSAHLYIAPEMRPLAFPIADLRAAPDNARRHGDADLNALSASLESNGQVSPLIGKRQYRGFRNVILVGCGRLEAARRLGRSHVAVVWLNDGISDEQAQAYAIADNRLAELSEWDTERLSALQADGVDLLSLWHDDAALADLLRAHAPVPKFEPVDAGYRLDELQPHCRTCTCRKEAR